MNSTTMSLFDIDFTVNDDFPELKEQNFVNRIIKLN